MSETLPLWREGLLIPIGRQGRRPIEARGGGFDRCGGRLKELFEKSSLRNLKNFPFLLSFIKMKISEPFGSEIDL